MNTNENILNHLIQKDLEFKGGLYALSDHIEKNPKFIRVGANETVYIHLFSRITKSASGFFLKVDSPSISFQYDETNNIEGVSNMITRHAGNIKFNNGVPDGFLIHYVRVKHL